MRTLRGGLLAAALVATSLGSTGTVGAQDRTFACDPGFYQVIAGQLGKLDPGARSYETIGAPSSSYNAMAYRAADGFMYGMRGSTLLRIDAQGTVATIGTIDGLSSAYVGEFGDDGLLHVSRGGRDWHAIDVDTVEATPIAAWSSYTAVADMTNVHGTFYGVSSDGALYAYDQSDLTVREVGMVEGLPETLKAYGAAWATAGGNLYVGRNSGEIYQITGYTTSTPKATQVGTSPSTNSNDGASCALAAPPAGLDDVDGPKSESEPSTQESKDAAASYEDDYDEIAEGFTPAEPVAEPAAEQEPNENTYEVADAGIGTGASCNNVSEDQPDRHVYSVMQAVSEPTTLYSTGFDGSSMRDFDLLSGSWTEGDGVLKQLNTCGYDLTSLLRGYVVENFRWEADVAGLDDHNQGGLIFNQSSTMSRSGAMIVDFTDGGKTLRWGYYDDRGYYVNIDSIVIADADPNQAMRLGVDVTGLDVTISLDGEKVAEATAPRSGGMVGLVTSAASARFDEVQLTALPAAANNGLGSMQKVSS